MISTIHFTDLLGVFGAGAAMGLLLGAYAGWKIRSYLIRKGVFGQ